MLIHSNSIFSVLLSCFFVVLFLVFFYFLLLFLNVHFSHKWKEKEPSLLVNCFVQCRMTIDKVARVLTRRKEDQHACQCSAWIQEGSWTSLRLWRSLTLQCSGQMNVWSFIYKNKMALLKDTEKNHPNSLLTKALMNKKRLSFRFRVWFIEGAVLQTFIARMSFKTNFCYLFWDTGDTSF